VKKLLSLLLLISFNVSAADDFSAVEAKLKKALKGPLRTEKGMQRDANRLPIETLKFFGLRDDMKVLELLPGNGWYTKLLAPVVVEDGELHVALGTKRLSDTLLGKDGLEFVNLIDTGADISKKEGDLLYTITPFEFGEKDFDIVFTFRNYHNFNLKGRTQMNKAVFDALKPGGIYAVVDHTRRHMEKINDDNRRRIDPVLAIKEVLDAGFIFVDYTDLHARSADKLDLEVGNKDVTGRTDRFTLKFIKPK